jgi:hypothetical protein
VTFSKLENTPGTILIFLEESKQKSITCLGKVESLTFFVEASVSPTSHQTQAATHQTQETHTAGWVMIKLYFCQDRFSQFFLFLILKLKKISQFS